jgi:D-aminoacyl-tRNA deacylase
VRLLLQRAARASVRVAGEVVGEIGPGLVALVGVGEGDTPEVATALARRTVELRIFRDPAGRTNLSLLDVGGEVLAISQFTLYADTSRGRRPSFIRAAPPELGQALYEVYAGAVAAQGVRVARGVFGAEMAVELVNDGPMTIWLEADAAAGSAAHGSTAPA